MTEFLFAQLIGFVGYCFYLSAPYFQDRKTILTFESIGCLVCCLHWFLLDVPLIAVSNLIWFYIALTGLVQGKSQFDKLLLSLAYPMVIVMSVAMWDGGVLCYTVLVLNMLAVTSKFFTDMLKFRSTAFAVGQIAVVNSVMAFSVPGVLFNAIFSAGHLLHIVKLQGWSFARISALGTNVRTKI